MNKYQITNPNYKVRDCKSRKTEMNKISMWVFILFLVGILSCSGSPIDNYNNVESRKKNVTRLRIDKKFEQLILQDKVYRFPMIKRDTLVGEYHIFYVIKDNDEVLITYPVLDDKGVDTISYAGREVILDIKYQQKKLLHKKINRTLFSSYIPNNELLKYTVSYFNIERTDSDRGIIFSISLCVPETDICYWFDLYISNDGDIKVNNITSNEGDDEW